MWHFILNMKNKGWIINLKYAIIKEDEQKTAGRTCIIMHCTIIQHQIDYIIRILCFRFFLKSSIWICIYRENGLNCRIRYIELIFCLFLFKELFLGEGVGWINGKEHFNIVCMLEDKLLVKCIIDKTTNQTSLFRLKFWCIQCTHLFTLTHIYM